MKYDNTRAFKKHLESAAPRHFSQVYAIIAKDEFERKQATGHLADVLKSAISGTENGITMLSGEQCHPNVLMTELYEQTFFTKKRILLVSSAESIPKPTQQKLQSYFAQLGPDVFLVLSASSLSRASNFYKQLEKYGVILDIPELKPWQKEKLLITEIAEQVARQQKQIEPAACSLLIQQMGTDSSLIFHEVERLICYCGDRGMITVRDVEQLSCKLLLDDAWQLGEMIFQRDRGSALKICIKLLRAEAPLLSLLRQLRYQMQTLLNICTILDHGGSSNEVQQEYPYLQGKLLQNKLYLAQQYGLSRCQKGLLHIDAAELSIKNTTLDPELICERLIMRLTD